MRDDGKGRGSRLGRTGRRRDLGGRLVSWGWVVWLGLILRVDGLALVLDVSDVAVVVIGGVGDGLDTAIGKVDLVGSGHGLTVSSLLGVEVGAGVVVGNAVLESVWLGGMVIDDWVGG